MAKKAALKPKGAGGGAKVKA
eukprot:SAG11_NODE_21804_length_418_cov_1.137931_1_plen_20_part_10